MKKYIRLALALTVVLAVTGSAGAQEQSAETKKLLKKRAAENPNPKLPEGAEPKKPTAVKKAAEEKTAEKAAEKKAETKKKAAEVAEEKKDTAPKTAEKKAAAKAGAPYTGGVVNLNTATKAQLEALPGIGEANADHIIKGRPYKSADELVTRKIVQERYYNAFKAHVTTK